MIPAGISETDLEMVARAGDWLEVVEVADASDEERALAGACAVVEAERRACEWAAFEQLVPYVVDGRVVPPASGPARVRVLEAVVELGWHHWVPVGRAKEATG